MKFFLILFISTCLVYSAANAFAKKTRIIGGVNARVGQFPWQAAIYLDNISGKYFCGGALITSQWILTAAHCVYGGRSFTIHLGSNTILSPDANRQILSSSTYVTHPQYDQTTLENDLGLIKLHMPVTFNDYIQKIDLASTSSEIADGMTVTITGYGQTSDSASGINNNLHYVEMTTISTKECQLTYGSQIKDGMVCAAGNYNEGICIGDTGGPLVKYGINAHPLLIGVASFMSQNGCESTDPTGYTKIHFYYDWITNVTNTL